VSRNTSRLSSVSLNLTSQSGALITCQDKLPHAITRVVPIPAPIGNMYSFVAYPPPGVSGQLSSDLNGMNGINRWCIGIESQCHLSFQYPDR
jgi:hypothetical protein